MFLSALTSFYFGLLSVIAYSKTKANFGWPLGAKPTYKPCEAAENTKKHLVRVEGKLHIIAYSVHPYTLLHSILEDYTVRYILIQHYTQLYTTTHP